MRPAPRGAVRLRGKEVVFFKRSGRGWNPGPRASEEDALSTPLRPTWLRLYRLQYARFFSPYERSMCATFKSILDSARFG